MNATDSVFPIFVPAIPDPYGRAVGNRDAQLVLGLTTLDYIAIEAMKPILAYYCNKLKDRDQAAALAGNVSFTAYEVAEAMIAESNRRKNG